MCVYLYDDALVKKIRYWSGDSKISISPPENLFVYRGDVSNKDKITFPLISITRGNITILNTNKSPLSREGLKRSANIDKITMLGGVPIRIPYQLDIYTRQRRENDDLMRELILKIINNPKLDIEIPYNNANLTHVFNLRLNNDIEDNSDVAEHLEKGEFFRTTLDLYIDDAYLFNFKAKDTISLDVDVTTT